MSDASDPAGPPASRRGLKSPAGRAGLVLGAIPVLAVAAVLGFGWWTHGRFVQSTNDAYLQADQVTVAPKVQGYVEEVRVRDNQAVAAGQPLVRIVTSSYDAALAQQVWAATERLTDLG